MLAGDPVSGLPQHVQAGMHAAAGQRGAEPPWQKVSNCLVAFLKLPERPSNCLNAFAICAGMLLPSSVGAVPPCSAGCREQQDFQGFLT